MLGRGASTDERSVEHLRELRHAVRLQHYITRARELREASILGSQIPRAHHDLYIWTNRHDLSDQI
jgi:hypothetical protein